MDALLDIHDLCTMLGVTSRTLRFYEQKGIIHSTSSGYTKRRLYSKEQIQEIKNVLILRSLGLPVSDIYNIQKGNRNLSEVMIEQKAHLLAAIASKAKELYRLEEALCAIENGYGIDSFQDASTKATTIKQRRMEISEKCTDSFITGDYQTCFTYFHQTLRNYLPLSAFQQVSKDTIKPLGAFIRRDKTVNDEKQENVYYSYLKYEKLGLSIKYVFVQHEICGIWLHYYAYKKENIL